VVAEITAQARVAQVIVWFKRQRTSAARTVIGSSHRVEDHWNHRAVRTRRQPAHKKGGGSLVTAVIPRRKSAAKIHAGATVLAGARSVIVRQVSPIHAGKNVGITA
jgi:hypothetical protein